MKKMQEIAMSLYDTTPELQQGMPDFSDFSDVPKHASKILANVKREDPRIEHRAQPFSSETMKKGGSIENKDLTVAMTVEDWETKYREIWDKYIEEQKMTKLLEDRLQSK